MSAKISAEFKRVEEMESFFYPENLKQVYQKAVEVENACLKKVITDFLGYEPTVEDYKKLSVISVIGIHDEYTLAFSGIPIGTVRKYFFNNNQYRVEFSPIVK